MLSCCNVSRHAMLVALGLGLAGCAGGQAGLTSGQLFTGSLSSSAPSGALAVTSEDAAPAMPIAGAGRSGSVAALSAAASGAKASASGSNVIAVARAMRAKGDRPKALATLEEAHRSNPGNRDVARDLGYLALELGQLDKARRALEAALDPARPDWRIFSALGTVHASAGDQKAAQQQFRGALALKPGHVPTTNNLALSYALSGDLAKAESTLRPLAAGASDGQIKENLALVLALAGKYDAAQKVAADVLPEGKVAANMEYLKSMKSKGG